MAEIERLAPPDDLPDGGAPDPAPGTTSETASRSANAASNDTGKEGITGWRCAESGVDLTAIPTIGPGTALVIASEIGGLLRLARPAPSTSAPGLRSRREPGSAAARTSPASPRRRSTPSGRPAHGGHGRAAARPHRRQAQQGRPNGVAIKATARELACLPHGDRRRNTSSRASTPTRSRLNRKFAPSRPPSPKPLQLRHRFDETDVNCLGNCYSRAQGLDPVNGGGIM